MPKINKADIETLRERLYKYSCALSGFEERNALKRLRATEKQVFGRDAEWEEFILCGLYILDDNYPEPNETYYKVFEALGYEITEDN